MARSHQPARDHQRRELDVRAAVAVGHCCRPARGSRVRESARANGAIRRADGSRLWSRTIDGHRPRCGVRQVAAVRAAGRSGRLPAQSRTFCPRSRAIEEHCVRHRTLCGGLPIIRSGAGLRFGTEDAGRRTISRFSGSASTTRRTSARSMSSRTRDRQRLRRALGAVDLRRAIRSRVRTSFRSSFDAATPIR